MTILPRLGSLLALDKAAEGEEQPIIMTEVMNKGKEQIEYYLSASNMENDSFMKEKYFEHEKNGIPIDLFMSFKKIKNLGISSDDLLLACGNSQFLLVDSENRWINRKYHIKFDARRKNRIIRASGFPHDSGIEAIFNTFTGISINPIMINMQYTSNYEGDRHFNGIIVAELSTENDVDKVLDSHIRFQDAQIRIETLVDYEKQLKKKTKH